MEPIEKILKRPRAYNNVDGVGELSVGITLLAYALTLWVIADTPGSSIWHKGVWLVLVALVALTHYGSKAIKERITYPRTGYVEYSGKGRRAASVVAAVTAAACALGLFWAIRTHRDLSIPCSFAGLAIAAAYARGFAGTAGWKWIAFAALAGGSAAIGFLPAASMGALARESGAPGVVTAQATGACILSFLFCGAVFLVSGGVSMGMYLRRTEPRARDAA